MNFESPQKNIDNKKIIITGGTEGIGRAIVKELSPGNDIVICARTKEKIEEIKNNYNIEAIQLDLGDTEKVKDFAKKSIEYLGSIDTIILNAAITGIRESNDYTFKVNRDAPITLIESVSKELQDSHGCIVLLTSSQSNNFIPGLEHYGQSKKDIEDWLINFSSKPENKNIKIFFVNPGHVDTRMNQEAIIYGPKEIKKRSIEAKDDGKFRDPNIIGRIISKISTSGNKFNFETNEYDIPLQQNETVLISDKNVEFELNNGDSHGPQNSK